MYIHSEYDLATYRLWIPRHLLPYDDVTNVAAQVYYNAAPIPPVYHPDDMRYEGPAWQIELEAVLTTQSSFGVMASTIYTIYDHADTRSVTVINYWIIDAASLTVTDNDICLPVPTLHPCIVIPGFIPESTLSTWYLCHVTNCGTYLILLSDEMGEIKIRLVHLRLPDYHFTVHMLVPPSFVKPHLVSGFFVDEHCGTVTLIEAEGMMFECEFV